MSLPETFDLPGGLAVHTLSHAQGTITPQLTLAARLSGGGWRALDDSEFSAEFLSASTVRLTFTAILPAHPATDAVRVTISNGTATAVIPSYAPGATGILQQGLQFFQAHRSTVTINIAGVQYQGGGGDLVRERDLMSGGWLNKYRVSFWVDLAQFAARNQPVPVAQQGTVTWQGVAYALDNVTIDGTGATVMLECKSLEE